MGSYREGVFDRWVAIGRVCSTDVHGRQMGSYREGILDGWVCSTYSVLCLDERVVDGDHVHGAVFDGVAEDDAADAAKAIDSYFSRHSWFY